MKTVALFVSLVGAAVCWGPQPVQDTPEVAAAKAAHLEAVSKAAHLATLAKTKQVTREKPRPKKSWDVGENTIKEESWKNQWPVNAVKDSWNQVEDIAQAEDDGSWKDDGTWKNYDDGTWNGLESTEAPKSEKKYPTIGEPIKWQGPIALPPGYDESGAPLPVEDTPEVAEAKAKHLQAYVKAAAKIATDPVPDAPLKPTAGPVPSYRPTAAPLRPTFHDSVVHPGLSPVSLIQPVQPPRRQITRKVPKDPAPIYETSAIYGVTDTPEVTAAKAKHLRAYVKATAQIVSDPVPDATPKPTASYKPTAAPVRSYRPTAPPLHPSMPPVFLIRPVQPPRRHVTRKVPKYPVRIYEPDAIDGVTDTPEVTAAKAAHFAAHAKRRLQ